MMNCTELKKKRFRGCLLGGACGDALGYEIEFSREGSIFQDYGEKGITRLSEAGDPARISDDTQMTLFCTDGIIIGDVWAAYLEWLGTQNDTSRMDTAHPKTWLYDVKELHSGRAPGNTCLNSLSSSIFGGTVDDPVNNSKGCGTVMRAAPWGLCPRYGETVSENPFRAVYSNAVNDGALTHGHPLGYISSGMLALIVYFAVHEHPERDMDLGDAVLSACGHADEKDLAMIMPGIEKAVMLAKDPSVSDLDGVHMLGEGWVAEEALFIAVFAAVRYQDDFAEALRCAVNHKGDSDSTGAVCGNILGAWLGEDEVARAMELGHLELRSIIEEAADDLFTFSEHGAPEEGSDLVWDGKYRRS